MFEDKRILITGGTGSLGQALTKRLLKEKVESIRIFSRNENNQISMERQFPNEDRIRFFIGDIRDKGRLLTAMEGVNVVFHTAALKHIDVVEYNPFESVKTNVIGSQNVIDVCHEIGAELAVGIGTDKAVAPLNVYGATKLLMEKMFVSASNYVDRKKHPTKFVAIRYGNVLGSSGSVVPRFIEQIISKQKISITDPKMTRFSITMDEALDFIFSSIKESKGSDTFVPKLKAYNIMDLKDTLFEMLGKTEYTVTKIRPGEKLAEVLISGDEMRNTLEGKKKYIITQGRHSDQKLIKMYPDYTKTKATNAYSSDSVEKLSKKDLIRMIKPLLPK
jgi:UDP-N-acetylglucosamine 4,6-dehydratase